MVMSFIRAELHVAAQLDDVRLVGGEDGDDLLASTRRLAPRGAAAQHLGVVRGHRAHDLAGELFVAALVGFQLLEHVLEIAAVQGLLDLHLVHRVVDCVLVGLPVEFLVDPHNDAGDRPANRDAGNRDLA
jgi:hypothetical protein